jgi:redox-sensitive bicupin YhaK (pirin superfamily)
MEKVIHRANTRGHANYGWLDTHHTFSFFRYHHPDRMNFGVLRVLNDDVQIMSAGSGLTHSEYNHSKDEKVNFLQIWILPKEQNIKPRYDQKSFVPEARRNKLQMIVSPEKDNGALWINQDAYFSRSELDSGKTIEYNMHQPENGLYLFMIDGEVENGSDLIKKRDGIGFSGIEKINLQSKINSDILLIEVPMKY